MKILYVFPEPLPLPRARGIQVANTVAALAQQGLHVCLAYVPSADHSDPIAAYGLERPRGVELIPLSRGLAAPFSKLPVHSNRLFFYRLQRWLGQEKNRGQAPVLVMARHLKIAHALLRAFPEIPLLYEAHEVFADVAPAAKRESLAQIERTVLCEARAVVAITHAAAADLKKRYQLKRELQVLPDAVAWPAQIPHKPWQQAGQHIIYAGSFFPWKGTQDLIAAAKSLRGCRITLIGGSPERIREYQSQVAADGAEVIFTGHIAHAQALEAISQACIAVLPNRADPNSLWSSPLKLFEYMACGCAVVASDIPSLREVLAEDEAIWAPPGNPPALVDAIRRLARDPSLAERMGARLRARAKSFTWHARAEKLAALMRTLV